MKQTTGQRVAILIPIGLAVSTTVALGLWLGPLNKYLELRAPGMDRPPGMEATDDLNPVLDGHLLTGEGKPCDLAGTWPGFRGSQRDGKSAETVSLAHSWESGGPRELWSIDV